MEVLTPMPFFLNETTVTTLVNVVHLSHPQLLTSYSLFSSLLTSVIYNLLVCYIYGQSPLNRI